MPSHRRGRSLSEGLTLEQSEQGGMVISSITDIASAKQGLREGDEIVGATINFDQLSKDEVLKVLKFMEPFDDKVQVLTKNHVSKSLKNLDNFSKTPEDMLKESYNKLYNARIKKFMKDNPLVAEGGCVNGETSAPGSSKLSLKQDVELPRLGVDFGFLKNKTLNTEDKSPSGDITFSAAAVRELNSGSNLNLPLSSLGTKVPANSGIQVPRKNVDAGSSQLNIPDLHLSGTLADVSTTAGINLPNTESPPADLKMPNLDRPQTGLENSGTFRAPGVDLRGSDSPDMGSNLNGGNITAPKVDIEVSNKKFKMPKFKVPDLDLSVPGLNGPEYEVKTPHTVGPDVASGKVGDRNSRKLKSPDLNVDDLSGYIGLPKVKTSGSPPDFGLEMPDFNVSAPHTDLQVPSGDVKMTLKKSHSDFKAPALDVDAPSDKFKMPKSELSGKRDTNGTTPDASLKMPSGIDTSDIKMPRADLKAQTLVTDIPAVDINGPIAKYKPPKFKMPKFVFSDSQGPSFNADLERPDVELAAPELKAGISGSNFGINVPSIDLKQPTMDIANPNGKLKVPDFGLSGSNVEGPDCRLKIPDLSGADLKGPKLDLNVQNMDINMPSGKLNLDADAPAGKLKMPKFKLFGTLPKKRDVDIDAGMKTPNVKLTSSNIKGIDAPDISVLKMDLRKPNLELHSPDVDMDSPEGKLTIPKMKMPSLDLSGPKRANIDVNGGVNRPDLTLSSGSLNADLSKPEFDIDASPINLKGPKSKLKLPDVDIANPLGKIKLPHFKMPDLGLSEPQLEGPELDIPDFDLSASKFKRNIGSPDLNLHGADLNQPKIDLTIPDVKLDMPSGKFKGPSMKKSNVALSAPDMHIDAPFGKFKMANLQLSDTIPKGPDLNINTDMNSPGLNLKTPKIKGGIDDPNLDFPNMNLKSPKLDINTPDVNISPPKAKLNAPQVNVASPKTKLKMPKLKMPQFSFPSLKGPEIDGNFDGPNVDINAPNINLKGPKADLEMPDDGISGPSGKLKKPNMNLPDLGLFGPKLDGPNFDLKSP
ncbi:hypothetical protein LDENG_00243490, partial [Lucifuga dentata]